MLNWTHVFDFSRSVLPMITLAVFIIGVMLRVTKWVSFGFGPHVKPKRLPPRSNRLIALIKAWSIEMIPPWDLSGRLAWAEDIAGLTMHATCILILIGALHVASVQNILNLPVHPSKLRLPVIPASSLPITIPRSILTYIITPIFLATLAILIMRRAEHYRRGGPLRILTMRTDWIASILLWLAGFTGFLAVVHIEPYTPSLTVHLILTQLFIIYLPYGKLVHSATVFLVRSWSGLRRGRYGV
jgi:nitrate reductase gamma subunit